MVRIRSTPKHRESSTALTVLRSCLLAFALTVVGDPDHQLGKIYPLTIDPLMCGTVSVLEPTVLFLEDLDILAESRWPEPG